MCLFRAESYCYFSFFHILSCSKGSNASSPPWTPRARRLIHSERERFVSDCLPGMPRRRIPRNANMGSLYVAHAAIRQLGIGEFRRVGVCS